MGVGYLLKKSKMMHSFACRWRRFSPRLVPKPWWRDSDITQPPSLSARAVSRHWSTRALGGRRGNENYLYGQNPKGSVKAVIDVQSHCFKRAASLSQVNSLCHLLRRMLLDSQLYFSISHLTIAYHISSTMNIRVSKRGLLEYT